jgi:probable rRNA maturation factor
LGIYLNNEQALALDLQRWHDRALAIHKSCGLDPEADEWSVTYVDDAGIRELNREYRQADKVTDVLSFALEDGDGPAPPPGVPRLLGDVVIAVPTALRQAVERGHSADAELGLLLIHGLLHLLGYDHDPAAKKKKMWGRQAELLGELGLEVFDFGDAPARAKAATRPARPALGDAAAPAKKAR